MCTYKPVNKQVNKMVTTFARLKRRHVNSTAQCTRNVRARDLNLLNKSHRWEVS